MVTKFTPGRTSVVERSFVCGEEPDRFGVILDGTCMIAKLALGHPLLPPATRRGLVSGKPRTPGDPKTPWGCPGPVLLWSLI